MEERKPRIGIVQWKVGGNSVGITLPYLIFFEQFGEVVLLNNNAFDSSIDLLVLPGGPDVNPYRYGQRPKWQTGRSCPYLEYFDAVMLPKYIKAQIPIFGIDNTCPTKL